MVSRFWKGIVKLSLSTSMSQTNPVFSYTKSKKIKLIEQIHQSASYLLIASELTAMISVELSADHKTS